MPAASLLVAVLGRGVVDGDQAVLSGDDLGLTRGDGCFDATRLVVGDDGSSRIDHLDAHLHRFARSAAALDLPPVDAAAWRTLIDEAVAAWDRPGEAVLRVMLTRGRETGSGTAITGVLTIAPLDPSAMATARAGLDVISLSRGHPADAFLAAPWLLGGVKTLSYAINVAAGREAARRGADEALFVSTDGYALEAPRSALVWLRGDALQTTSLEGTGILASVTQAATFAAARASGVATSYDLIALEHLFAVDAAWLVSAGRGVAPISTLDGTPMATDETWTARLRTWSS